jgi:SpoVK/Ycf46/Vps4 family AAA+-type ATPase
MDPMASPDLFAYLDYRAYLRDVYQALKGNYKTVFVAAPQLAIPNDLAREIQIFDLGLPTMAELVQLFDQVCQGIKNVQVDLSDEDKEEFGKAALGMTLDEARLTFNKSALGKTRISMSDLAAVIEEKSRMVRREGLLEFIPVEFGMEEVGGLANLKKWLEVRGRFFTKDARDFGITAPKGVLMTGISGCGKSLCVKAISQYWRLPLMRLDMMRIFSGVAGNPEHAMRRALETVEALAPVVLWIDEIENALAGQREGDGGVTNRIFSSFLTWMQERKQMVFLAATANQINQLPAELLRKGRFDEIFFVDLPGEDDRKEIFRVHLQKRGHDPSKFSLVNLAKGTNNFNGAEIEQCVVSGLFEAFNEKRPLHENDLYKTMGRIVPLATTMAETIKEIKRWADTRAVKAS